MKAKSIVDVMICWTPKADCYRDLPTFGMIELISWPDTVHNSRRFPMSEGACDVKVHGWTKAQREYFVMSVALGLMARSNMDAEVVHAALWPLIEYRAALPPDTPCPAGDLRFGSYAAAEEDAESLV